MDTDVPSPTLPPNGPYELADRQPAPEGDLAPNATNCWRALSTDSLREDSDAMRSIRSTTLLQYPDYPNLSEYQLSATIGSGNYGKVYLARRHVDGHICAMKVMAKEDSFVPEATTRLKNEAEILALFDHPFIVRIEVAFQNNDFLFIGLQVVTNGTFSDYLKAYAPMTTSQSQFYVYQLVEALDYIHSKFIVHADVKPDNILVAESGYLKLTDFGLAYDMSPEVDAPPAGGIGTTHYMSPEMITGTRFGPCNDWWALGVIMYQCTFARLPFDAEQPKGPPFHEDFVKNKVHRLITKGCYELPLHLDSDARSLLTTLLHNDPLRRNAKAEQIIKEHHSYFKWANWEHLRNRVYKPPFQPPRPGLNPPAHRWKGQHSFLYVNTEIRTRDCYAGFFDHFHYVRTPWNVSKNGRRPYRLPPAPP